MQKLEVKNKSLTDQELLKTVTVFIGQELYSLGGEWIWDMQTNSVYCSDVISFPSQFQGTKAIIHPDDLKKIKEGLKFLQNSSEINIDFRIITTYGEVRSISGCDISIIENELVHVPWQEELDALNYQNKLEASTNHAELLTILNNFRDKINLVGCCYINTNTLETWYSDNIYRIFGLYPQSLNNHLYTFSNFLYSDDRGAVIEAFERAFRHKLPLHLDFRIESADSKIKNVRINTYWSHNKSGHEYLFAVLRDETEQTILNDKLQKNEAKLLFQQQLLEMNEEELKLGNWNINLITRNVYFSDSFFRLFGTKRPDVPVAFQYFINFIHPEDQQQVSEVFENMIADHLPVDIEFKLLRYDGKIRFLRIIGKLLSIQNEPIIAGILQDITFLKSSKARLNEYSEQNLIHDLIQKKQEEMNRHGSWLWNLTTDQITLSDGMYSLVGYKARSIELDSKKFLNFIDEEDKKLFSEHLKEIINEGKESSFNFHLNAYGCFKFINATFRLIQFDDNKIFYALFSDETEKEELKNEVIKTSFLSTKVLENIKEAVIVTDHQNNIKVWNRQCENIFSKTKDEAILNNLFDLCPFLKINEVFAGIRSALSGQYIQLSKLHFSSFLKNVNWQMIPINNPDSDELNILHVIMDLNMEVNLEQSLKNNKSLLESISELSDDLIIALDKNLNYIIWNQKCERYFNIDRGSIIGQNILEYFPDSTYRPAYSEFKKALSGEIVYLEQHHKDQTELVRTFLVPIKENQIVTGLLWIIKGSYTPTFLMHN